MDLGTQASGIGALADETRRALYAYVVAQPAPVNREQAASALDLAPSTANFHLDKLVTEGLLEVEYRRLSGRTGPGAGRPSKLYRRADQQFAVSLPERRYDLVGQILAAAVTSAGAGAPLDDALDSSARDEGLALGAAAARAGAGADLAALADVLGGQGYEPRVEETAVVLANCPFDSLARTHTDLVCGLNRAFVQGVADGLGCAGARACLEPAPDTCCVTVRPD
jgi:predicted ArsR family transcriptional regulator